MIILALDYGTKNIGVAVGQKITKTAQSLITIKVKNNTPDWKKIKKLITEWNPIYIIVGLPLKLNGKKQTITKKTENFAKELYIRYKIKVQLHDERLSTKEAKSILLMQKNKKNIKNKIHSVSAVLILESWFANKKYKNNKFYQNNKNNIITS